MVSEFFFRGLRAAYARVLGGLAVRLAHLRRAGGLGEGLPRSPRDLNGRAVIRPPDPAAPTAPPLVAEVDPAKCVDCRERSIGQPEGGCRAAETCPGFAFERRVDADGRGYWRIDSQRCVGCGTCVPVRGGCGAISLRERGAKDAG
jgi:Pyruvate/2-oxoacid:ferredoxin oxidoreductase delta subunit